MRTLQGILFWIITTLPGGAAGVEMMGVLANSGEQGPALARFEGSDMDRNLGVIYTEDGSIWTGGAEGELLRYAVDGRLLGVYPVPPAQSRTKRYQVVLCGDSVIVQVGEILYRLPVDAVAGTEMESLDVSANKLSWRAHDGWLAAASGNRIFRVNASGETQPVGEVADDVYAIEIGPEGDIYVQLSNHMLRDQSFIKWDEPEKEFPIAGMYPQWIDDHWYVMNYHGTTLRFDRELNSDPGVALGGNSGSFIGYVPGDYELNIPTGIARLGEEVYAIKGGSGVVLLIQWDSEADRFTRIRRIGPLRYCRALGMDNQGRIWVNGGVIRWEDDPDAPFEHGVPNAGAESKGNTAALGVEILGNDSYIAALQRPKNSGSFFYGAMDGPARGAGSGGLIPESFVAACLIRWGNDRPALLMLDETGRGTAVFVSPLDARPSGKAGEVALEASPALSNLMSLASDGKDRIWAAADGYVVAFERDGETWKEKNRWKGNRETGLGEELHLGYSDNLLWVSDTERHRVFVLDTVANQLRGHFGILDEAGSGMDALNEPRAITAQGSRAVVYDSANQRLIKLQCG
ncbi:MAG: hypothetical protein ACQKBT_06020, partial [Puniceicoccales bacterium]